MKHKFQFASGIMAFIGLAVIISACEKDVVANQQPSPTPVATSASFVEEFNNVGDLSAKGWVMKNNSQPIGQTGWRQGRYESASQQQYKFLGPVPFLGFPAYSASTSPNDFVSCDATVVNDAVTGSGEISAWLISPELPIKNGDKIIFLTRAVDDALYGWYSKDRMQVRANFSNDGSADVGNTPTSTGRFTNVLADINPKYIFNDPSGNTPAEVGYPRNWTRVTLTVSGLTAPVQKARFAFRYLGTDAGVFGGTSGDNYPSVVGIDSLAFVQQ
jgi:hypothetical protein